MRFFQQISQVSLSWVFLDGDKISLEMKSEIQRMREKCNVYLFWYIIKNGQMLKVW